MQNLYALPAEGLPPAFDLSRHGAKPIVTLSLEEKTLRLSFAFPGFSFADLAESQAARVPSSDPTAFQHEVGISGAGFLSESGRPLLPSFGRFIQIPPGYTWTVHEKRGGLQTHERMKIRPAQENARDQEAWTLEFDEKTYGEDKCYPEKVVEVSGPFYMDGYRALCIHVRPMQYNPVRQVLHCYGNIEVAIMLEAAARDGENPNGEDEVAPWVYLDRTGDLEGFGNFLFNPERKYFEKAGLQLPSVRPRPTVSAPPEFIILHGDAFEAPARRLQAWKQKCGLDTALVPVSAVLETDGGARSNEERVRKIKAYLRGLRGRPWSPLRYALLLGDIQAVPTEERRRQGTQTPSQADTTDYYYFTHRDARGTECLLPWIAGGRLAAANAQEAMAVVDQIVAYEKDPPLSPEYFQRMAVAAYFQDCDPGGGQDGRANQAYLKTMESIRRHMRAHGFEVSRVYVSNNPSPQSYSDGSPVPLEVREAMIEKKDAARATKKLIDLISEGQLILGHRGHGDRRGWLQPPLRTDDLGRIASPNPSIFFSINCRTGSFDSGRACFAEAILGMPGAAPSLIAATELSGAWRNDSMIKALFDAIWPGIIPTYPVTTTRLPVKYFRLGDVLTYAKTYLLAAHGVNANTQKHLEIYHVVGDPTLAVWGQAPAALRLRARLNGDILVVTMNACPQDGALSVWFGDRCVWKTRPSAPRMAIPLMLLDRLPDDVLDARREQSYHLSVYFAAPGHRLAASHLWF